MRFSKEYINVIIINIINYSHRFIVMNIIKYNMELYCLFEWNIIIDIFNLVEKNQSKTINDNKMHYMCVSGAHKIIIKRQCEYN